MPSTLPSRLYHAHVERVPHLNCVQVRLSLQFGITIQKNLIVEGIDAAAVPAGRRSEAMHCLVTLLGGRDVIVHTDDSTVDGFLKSRVYLDEVLDGLPEGVSAVPYGLDEPRLEVGLMWEWVGRQDYDQRAVARCLRRQARGAG